MFGQRVAHKAYRRFAGEFSGDNSEVGRGHLKAPYQHIRTASSAEQFHHELRRVTCAKLPLRDAVGNGDTFKQVGPGFGVAL